MLNYLFRKIVAIPLKLTYYVLWESIKLSIVFVLCYGIAWGIFYLNGETLPAPTINLAVENKSRKDGGYINAGANKEISIKKPAVTAMFTDKSGQSSGSARNVAQSPLNMPVTSMSEDAKNTAEVIMNKSGNFVGEQSNEVTSPIQKIDSLNSTISSDSTNS